MEIPKFYAIRHREYPNLQWSSGPIGAEAAQRWTLDRQQTLLFKSMNGPLPADGEWFEMIINDITDAGTTFQELRIGAMSREQDSDSAVPAGWHDDAMTTPSVTEALHLLGHIEYSTTADERASYIRLLRMLISKADIAPRSSTESNS